MKIRFSNSFLAFTLFALSTVEYTSCSINPTFNQDGVEIKCNDESIKSTAVELYIEKGSALGLFMLIDTLKQPLVLKNIRTKSLDKELNSCVCAGEIHYVSVKGNGILPPNGVVNIEYNAQHTEDNPNDVYVEMRILR